LSNMSIEDWKYDVAIIGSGIGGSTLAAVLARQGLSVLVLEASTHPRFAIGESMILETSELMRALARFYEVPELAFFSSENYLGQAGSSHGIKRHFGYVHHTAGQPLDISLTLQAIIPEQPYGHELHLFRQDTDSYLTAVAISCGATVIQGTLVIDIDIQDQGVALTTSRGRTFRAEYLVDAGGYRSFVAEKKDLRHGDLLTHTRGMYTHMVDVPCFHEVSAPRAQYGIPFRLSEGTLHHIFQGGWLWVIPFNNHLRSTNPLCSVGLLLDPRVHPARPELTPEEEFHDFVGRSPALAAQFRRARAVREWVRADRLQYSSRQVVGERFALLGQAAGFVDPLYSKGLYITHMGIMVLADLLLAAHRTGDYSAAAFAPLERLTLDYVRMNDRLVANSLKSWSNHRLWRVYSVQWLLGAYLEYLMLSMARLRSADRREYLELLRHNRLAGGGFSEFFEVQERIDALFEGVDPADEAAVDKVVVEACGAFASLPWLPEPFREVLKGKNYLPKRKFRLSLFSRKHGFLGSGAYRRHFFGSLSMAALAFKAAAERIRYSRRALRRRNLEGGRIAWLAGRDSGKRTPG